MQKIAGEGEMAPKNRVRKRATSGRHMWWHNPQQITIDFSGAAVRAGKGRSLSPKFILTLDVAPTIFNKYKARPDLGSAKRAQKEERLVKAALSKVRKFEKGFAEEFSRIVSSRYKTVSYTTKDLGHMVEGSLKLNSEFPVVSLDDRVFPIKGSEIAAYLNVRRLADRNGDIVGITSREGFPPVESQVQGLVDMGLREIELVDVGIWTGGTVVELIGALGHPDNVRIVAVYFAIAAMDKSKETQEILKSHGIDAYIPLPAELVVDWVTTTHILNFTGMAGEMPNGRIGSMSYWDWLPKWASIPKEHVEGVRQLCMKYRFEILHTLEELHSKVPRLGDYYPLDAVGN